MFTKRLAAFVAALLILPTLLSAQPSNATSRWSLEFSGDGAFPTSELGSASLNTGFGLGASARFRLQQHLLAYAGWEWHRFSTDELIASQSLDAEDTGYSFGLRFEHPFRDDAAFGDGLFADAGYWLRAGGLWNHIEVEDEAGEIIADTKHGIGYELGAGIVLPISERLALTPGVRFRSLPRDLTLNTTTQSVTLQYVNVMVGLTIAF